jgi:hypothetical protein
MVTSFNLSPGRERGQESIIFVFLDLFFGQSAGSGLCFLGLMRG